MNMKSIIKNKKAFLGDTLLSFYSYIVIILILLVFFFIFAIMPQITSHTIITAYSEDVSANTALRNILYTPIPEISGWTVADLMIYTSNVDCNTATDNKYCDILKKRIVWMLQNFRNGKNRLIVTLPTSKEVIFNSEAKLDAYLSKSETKIPSHNGDIIIILESNQLKQNE
jgi:amino acid permease